MKQTPERRIGALEQTAYPPTERLCILFGDDQVLELQRNEVLAILHFDEEDRHL